MRKNQTWLLLTTMLLLAYPAAADWDQTEPAKWVQFPDLSTMGIDVNASYSHILADDFQCTEQGYITDVHIWGSWRGDQIPFQEDPEAVRFILSLHQDIPDSLSPTGYSMPGDPVWTYAFQPGDFTARIWQGQIEEGWMDPPDNYVFPGDWTCWQYNFFIPTGEQFWQEGTASDPKVYWLNVKAVPEDSTAVFGWKTSLDHWNDDAVWVHGSEPYYGDWNELIYPPGHEMQGQSIDLAFVITGEPQPQESDWGDAPDSPLVPGYPTLAINNGAYHPISGPWLGDASDAPDSEGDGQPDPNALGDDLLDGNDDEDGVTIPPLIQGQVATISFQVSGGGGFVVGWIDYNQNQVWQSPGERIITGWHADGLYNYNITVPAAAVLGQSFARFRISTVGGMAPVGAATDGEVEDYEVTIREAPQTYKWEQLPDLNETGIDVNATIDWILADDYLCTQSGPIVEVHVFGSWLYDYLPFGDDPENVKFTLSFHADIPAGTGGVNYSRPGNVLWWRTFQPGEFTAEEYATNIMEGWMNPPDMYFFPADSTCWLYKFPIDAAEAFHQEGTPSDSLVYWLDVQADPYDLEAQFGWKTSLDHWNDDAVWGQGGEPYLGPWFELIYPPNHELYGQSIDLAFRLFGEETQLDYGDAPDPPYPTWAASNGASHIIVTGVHMGNTVDAEPDGQPNANATGDDIDGNNDDDGVIFTSVISPGGVATVTVDVSTNGVLDAWIDFNADGNWSTPGDQIFAGLVLAAGTHNLNFNVPITGTPGQISFARFRFNTGILALSYDGPAPDGEVEDYEVWIEDDLSGSPEGSVPDRFELHASVPNPFNPMTSIHFDLPTTQHVELTVYTVDGRRVATLTDEQWPAGKHAVLWNGRDEAGQRVASGSYIYRIKAGEYEKSQTMMLIK